MVVKVKNELRIVLEITISFIKMKIKQTNIVDHNGNVNEIRAIVRVLVWGIVEQVQINNDIDITYDITTNDIDYNDINDDNNLPIQFGSSKSRSSRKKRKKSKPLVDHNFASTYANELVILPKPKFNKTLLENNINKMIPSKSINFNSSIDNTIVTYVYTRTLGIGPTPNVSTLLLRVIGCSNHNEDQCELCNYYQQLSNNTIEVDIALLQPLSSDDLYQAYLMVQKDEEYLSIKDVPEHVHIKYWNQRYRILSLFDKGIKLDPESWYSITPESIAKHVTASCIGRAIERKIDIRNVLDCFSGCGGNTIPFAKKSYTSVTAIDIDTVKLQYLKYNASIYECDHNVSLICADVYQFLSSLIPKSKLKRLNTIYNSLLLVESSANNNDDDGKRTSKIIQKDNHIDNIMNDSNNIPNHISLLPDLIILSPPWGGPGYIDVEEYDLYTMLTCGCGLYLTMLAAAVCPNILYLLPYNTSNEQLQYIAEVIEQPYVIEDISINHNKKLKAIYFGPMVKCKDKIIGMVPNLKNKKHKNLNGIDYHHQSSLVNDNNDNNNNNNNNNNDNNSNKKDDNNHEYGEYYYTEPVNVNTSTTV